MIDFNENAAKALEAMYVTPDVVAQRCRVMEALGLSLGEAVLDIGVGPGLLLWDIAKTVGETGMAAGLDMSQPMLDMSAKRCAGLPHCRFEQGKAESLPFDDESFDAVVSTQVYEYVADMETALAEARRVLKPGGRLVVIDTDWDSIVWRSSDPERTARVLKAWDAHLADPYLPRRLPSLMRGAGFSGVRTEVIPMCNPEYTPHSYSGGMMHMIAGFVSGKDGITPEEATAWKDDLIALGATRDYFFSLNRYLFAARK